SEQHDLRARLADDRSRPPREVGRRPQERRREPVDGVRLRVVVLAPLRPVRREDRDPVGRELLDQCVQRALDPAHAGREVVGHEERPWGVHRGYPARTMNDETQVLDLSQWRTREVTGTDAADWLEDLISASLRGMDR